MIAIEEPVSPIHAKQISDEAQYSVVAVKQSHSFCKSCTGTASNLFCFTAACHEMLDGHTALVSHCCHTWVTTRMHNCAVQSMSCLQNLHSRTQKSGMYEEPSQNNITLICVQRPRPGLESANRLGLTPFKTIQCNFYKSTCQTIDLLLCSHHRKLCDWTSGSIQQFAYHVCINETRHGRGQCWSILARTA